MTIGLLFDFISLLFSLYTYSLLTCYRSVQTKWKTDQGKLYQVNIRRESKPSIEVIVYNINSNTQLVSHSLQAIDLADNSQ